MDKTVDTTNFPEVCVAVKQGKERMSCISSSHIWVSDKILCISINFIIIQKTPDELMFTVLVEGMKKIVVFSKNPYEDDCTVKISGPAEFICRQKEWINVMTKVIGNDPSFSHVNIVFVIRLLAE